MNTREAILWLEKAAKHFEPDSPKNAANARKIADLIIRLERNQSNQTPTRAEEKVDAFLRAARGL